MRWLPPTGLLNAPSCLITLFRSESNVASPTTSQPRTFCEAHSALHVRQKRAIAATPETACSAPRLDWMIPTTFAAIWNRHSGSKFATAGVLQQTFSQQHALEAIVWPIPPTGHNHARL